MPGPLEEMVPEAPMTRCQGIGGLVLGGKNFRAAHDSFFLFDKQLWEDLKRL